MSKLFLFGGWEVYLGFHPWVWSIAVEFNLAYMGIAVDVGPFAVHIHRVDRVIS